MNNKFWYGLFGIVAGLGLVVMAIAELGLIFRIMFSEESENLLLKGSIIFGAGVVLLIVAWLGSMTRVRVVNTTVMGWFVFSAIFFIAALFTAVVWTFTDDPVMWSLIYVAEFFCGVGLLSFTWMVFLSAGQPSTEPNHQD